MKRWIVNGLLALFVFLVAYKHDVVLKIVVFIKDIVMAFINGAGDIIGKLI